MVTGRYGAGTVLYFGFHGTYKWRSLGVQSAYFDRFWDRRLADLGRAIAEDRK